MDILHILQLLYYGRCPSSVLELDTSYDWQVMAPNTHHSLFLINPLCILTRTTWKLQVVLQTFYILNDCYTIRDILVWYRVGWEIQLESYGPRHASVILWYNSVCVYCKPIHASLFGAQLHMTTKLTYLMTAYYAPNDGFTANDTSFCENKVG